MSEEAKVVRALQKELFKKVQKLSRSKKKLWNEVFRLLPKANLGAETTSSKFLVLREKCRDRDRYVFVDLNTGILTGDRDRILSLDPKLLNPERTIKTLKMIIQNQKSPR